MILYIPHAGLGHPSPFFYNLLKEFEKYKDIEIIVSPDLPTTKVKNGIIYFHRLKRFYSSEDINSVHLFLNKIDELKANGWKIIWTIHNFFPIDRKITNVDEYLLEEFLNRVDIIFTITEYMKRQLHINYKKDAIVHSIGINNLDGWFDKNEFNIELPKDAFVFSFVGNITKYKMLDQVVETFKKMQLKNSYLLIAGAGNKSNCFDFSNLPENVIYYENFVGNSDWKKICDLTNVFVNIYDLNYENFRFGFFPSNCIQLLNMGKVSISPKSEIFTELMPSTALIEYDFNDQEGLLNAMVYAYNNKNNIKEMEKHINADYYNWDKTLDIIVQKTKELFNEKKN